MEVIVLCPVMEMFISTVALAVVTNGTMVVMELPFSVQYVTT